MNRMKNRHGISIALLIIFIAALTMLASAQTSQNRRKVDKSTILYLFQNQGFKQLSSKLEEFQKAYEGDYQGEDNLYNAFDVFSKADTAFGSLLAKWIKEYPDSYVPYVARAKYYCACAWQARGRKWAIDRERKEYKEMERCFSSARVDIDEALKKNIQLDVCYAMMVEIGMATANEEMKTNALANALKNHPYAYKIRLKYLQTLTPRWGGSYQKMAEFIDSCKNDIVHNPKLKELASSIPYDKGSVFYYLGKYEDAVKMYTEAIKYSEQASYYAERGDAYARLGNYRLAISDYDNVLRLSPNDPDYLNRKANVSKMPNAGQTNQQVQRYNPNDDRKQDLSLISERTQATEHAKKGSNFLNTGRYEEAVAEFSEVIRIFSYDYNAYNSRAICYLQLRNEEAALQDLLRVVELKRDNIRAYFPIATIYANRGMYENALNSMNTVLSMDPNNVEALFYRAKIFIGMGSHVEGMNDAKQACEMGYQPACKLLGMTR
jgi:tetratricopeptide (TPR) repeat protein